MKRVRKTMQAMFLCMMMVTGLLPGMTGKAKALEVEGTNYIVSTENDLKDAIAAINAGESGEYSITLAADIVVQGSGSTNPKLEKNSVTIYGENHTLYMEKACIMVTGNATLNLGAEDYEKTLKIVDKAPETGNACEPLVTANSATLNMYDGVTLSGRNGVDTTGGVQAENKGTFTMYGGEISDCRSDTAGGGVLAAEGSHFIMSGGTIKNCKNSLRGGGVSLFSASSFEMKGGTIQGCDSQGSGGGVYAAGQSSFSMSGGTIEECSSVNYGGGVYLGANSECKITGGTIKGCTNSYVGGAGVCVGAPGNSNLNSFEMTGGEIKNCTANDTRGGLGGGVLVMNGSAIIGDGAKIHNNQAVTAGDDFFAYGATSGRNPTATKLKFAAVPEGLILSETNLPIDGWYVDGVVDGENTDRWDMVSFVQKCEPSPETAIETQLALKAAHAKPTVKLTAKSGTETYDGTEKSVSGYTCSEDGVAFADTVKAYGSGTKAGEYDVTFSGVTLDETTDTEGIYVVSETVNGKLTIEKRAVTITGDSATKTYDGTALTKNSATCEGLADGDQLSAITLTGSITDTGSTENIPSAAKIVNAAGEDVTTCYEITYENGTLTVEKAPAPKELAASEKPSVSAEDLIENGAEQALIIAPGKLPEGYKAIEYSKDGGETWTTEIPTGKEVGEYSIQVRYIADENHTDFAGETLTARIKEKPATSTTTDEKESVDSESPPTGDAVAPILWMALISAMAFVIVIRKKLGFREEV